MFPRLPSCAIRCHNAGYIEAIDEAGPLFLDAAVSP